MKRKVRINGETREVAGATVGDAIRELELPWQSILAEHNGIALRREEWNRPISEGDTLELIRIVAGG